MKSKAQKVLEVLRLGYRWSDTCLLALVYVVLTLRRRLGFSPLWHRAPHITLQFKGLSFPFVFASLIDIDLTREIFVENVYATDTPPSATIIFDLGSNKGASVIYFAALFPHATIYAFEPDPRNVALLKETITPVKDRVVLYEQAVTQQGDGSITLYYSDKVHWSSGIYPREKMHKAVQVPATSLDRVVKEQGIGHIDLLKFDIEGAEYEVFTGCRSLSIVDHIVGEIHPEMNEDATGVLDDVPCALQEHFHVHRSRNIIENGGGIEST